MRKENLFYTLGLLLIAAALMLSGYNAWMDHQAGAASAAALEELRPLILPAPVSHAQRTDAMELPEYELNPDVPMPVQTINGYDYIGVLSIPTLELELPVLDRWDYDLLNISICRFTGSVYRQNMVICGHNYPLHFGTLKSLRYGDPIQFTDMDGNCFSYTVAEIEILPGEALEEMTAGDYPLTLFTCDLNRTNRVTVRCTAANEW